MPRYRCSALWFLLLLPALAACPNNTGITCPDGNPSCDVPVDLTVAPPPDFAACFASCTRGCCDTSGECKELSKDTCSPLGSGKLCQQCDPMVANVCTTTGKCICSNEGAPCDLSLGLRCDDNTGKCICDAKSCPDGCCKPFTQFCYRPKDLGHCAPSGGGVCKVCNNNGFYPVADSCGDGCRCGGGSECPDGKVCKGGQCLTLCNPTSCPKGCCADPVTCIMPGTAKQCGAGGGACKTCDPSADGCTNGFCSCGTNSPCTGSGQRCVQGFCKCDPTLCQTGQTCSNNTCL